MGSARLRGPAAFSTNPEIASSSTSIHPHIFPWRFRSLMVVQLLSHVQLFAIPWIEACQASLSFTISLSLLILMSIESVRPSNHFILCCPLLLLPSIFPSIRVFSSESVLHLRWPKYWGFSFSINSSTKYLHPLELFSHSVMKNSFQPHGLQHARLPCPSLSPRV